MSDYYKQIRKRGEEGHDIIHKLLHPDNKPILAGKMGALEILLIIQNIYIKMGMLKDYNPQLVYDLAHVAGLHPTTKESLEQFIDEYLLAVSNLDIMASWHYNILDCEEKIWRTVNKEKSVLVDLCCLESFYTTPNYWWQHNFQHKTILVISPFTDSIQKQLNNRNNVWIDRWENFWPDNITFKFIKFPHPYAISSKEQQAIYPKTWQELVAKYKTEIDKIGDFDLALVGTGAYSLLLCSYIKNKGKFAYHLGGGLQMMFGVYGGRWDVENHSFFKNYVNKNWIRPSGDEIPEKYKLQENGAYF